eukprot:6503265-Prorocentrum_lima.AAC.1
MSCHRSSHMLSFTTYVNEDVGGCNICGVHAERGVKPMLGHLCGAAYMWVVQSPHCTMSAKHILLAFTAGRW